MSVKWWVCIGAAAATAAILLWRGNRAVNRALHAAKPPPVGEDRQGQG